VGAALLEPLAALQAAAQLVKEALATYREWKAAVDVDVPGGRVAHLDAVSGAVVDLVVHESDVAREPDQLDAVVVAGVLHGIAQHAVLQGEVGVAGAQVQLTCTITATLDQHVLHDEVGRVLDLDDVVAARNGEPQAVDDPVVCAAERDEASVRCAVSRLLPRLVRVATAQKAQVLGLPDAPSAVTVSVAV
jgi:hypothetical protein